MRIQSAQFLKGVIGTAGLPQPMRPTFALFGSSNVGKSSIVNQLAQSQIARANKKPGRTTEINYYLLNGNFYLADLPGYGYAKLPPTLRKKISGYLSWFAADRSIDLRLAILVIDAAIGPKPSDQEMFALLSEYNRPLLILANKTDKANQRTLQAHLLACQTAFPGATLLSFSAKTGKGSTELWHELHERLT